jgi:hypothetical protein
MHNDSQDSPVFFSMPIWNWEVKMQRVCSIAFVGVEGGQTALVWRTAAGSSRGEVRPHPPADRLTGGPHYSHLRAKLSSMPQVPDKRPNLKSALPTLGITKTAVTDRDP